MFRSLQQCWVPAGFTCWACRGLIFDDAGLDLGLGGYHRSSVQRSEGVLVDNNVHREVVGHFEACVGLA